MEKCFFSSPGPQTLALPLLAPRDSFPVKAWNHFLFEVEVMSAHPPDSHLSSTFADGVGVEKEIVASILATHLKAHQLE